MDNEIFEAELSDECCEDMPPDVTTNEETETDFSEETDELLSDDLKELSYEFSELASAESISDLPNPVRYGALRDLGLTPREAYLASSPPKKPDSRAHLRSGVPGMVHSKNSKMTQREWRQAREIFSNMSDREIENLYKTVTK